MNKQELQKLLTIARPAIIAVYGRGRDFHVTAYFKISDTLIWIEIQAWYHTDWETFKLKLDEGEVTYLNKGKFG